MSDEPTQRVDEATLEGGDTSERSGSSDVLLERGAILDRYVVLGPVGSGGMGAVFAAYDPELDRKVALKLLLPERGGSAGGSIGRQERLVREAQAMARLRHPNVCAVYDVGVVAGRVFVAMQFVEGTTLSRWLERERSLPEILDVMIGAGRGLAAAHTAGLVHRDFKPDNVLVGNDGTVVVTDFGLARAVGAGHEGSAAAIAPGHALSDTLTASGSMVGTPAYMAPEQFERGDAGPQADQFAFCVALHQALYGVRPFPASSIAELVDRVTTGRVADPPPGRRIPAWLRRVILRGLTVAPGERWSSMDALLDRLGRDPIARRRRVLGLVGGLGITVAAGVFVGARASPGPADPCPRADARVAQLWNDDVRAQVNVAFAASGLPYAERSAEQAIAIVDGKLQAWLDGAQASCVATRVDGSQSETMLDLRSACLERRWSELAARIDGLSRADPSLVERAIEYATRTVPIDVCADVEALASAALRPEDPEIRGEVDAIMDALARLDAVLVVGAPDADALARSTELATRADATGHDPTRAEALFRVARLQTQAGTFDVARVTMERALTAAARGHDDRLAADIWSDLVFLVGYELERTDEGLALAQAAELAVLRHGDEPEQRAVVDTNIGSLLRVKGEFDRAIERHSHALELRRAMYGEDDYRVASTMGNLANAYAAAGRFERALEIHEEALALRRRVYGDVHPRTAESLNNVAAAYHALGRMSESLACAQQALDIRIRVFGREHPLVIQTMTNVGAVTADVGRYAEAEKIQREALALGEKVWSSDSPRLAQGLNNLANTLERQGGRVDEALALHERSLALRKAQEGAESQAVAVALSNIAVLLDNAGRKAEARERYTAALAILDRVAPDHPDSVSALMRLGYIEFDAGDAEAAVRLGQRAVKICEQSGYLPVRHAEAEFLLAKASWQRGLRVDAVAHAQRARELLAGTEMESDVADDLEAWLAAHAKAAG